VARRADRFPRRAVIRTGMGEVYRARDTLLGHEPAIKIISRTDHRRF